MTREHDQSIPAHQAIAASRPQGTYRGAVVGCGRMGSTIDDEMVGMPYYPGRGHTARR